ncbi:hypothetical protein [Brevundimonas sp.]|uniref:hypothetical protein n=1 Tax=Brevundimonas sp. TaxID=1871086 RepID=UPI0025C1B071|nr:hypothetical protein [Brevundimonas sp.]
MRWSEHDSEHDAVFEPAWTTKEAIWDLVAKAPIQTHADAAGKLAVVLAWIDEGNAERADGTDRSMLGEVLAFLRGH